jgi:hypothetical protein
VNRSVFQNKCEALMITTSRYAIAYTIIGTVETARMRYICLIISAGEPKKYKIREFTRRLLQIRLAILGARSMYREIEREKERRFSVWRRREEDQERERERGKRGRRAEVTFSTEGSAVTRRRDY